MCLAISAMAANAQITLLNENFDSYPDFAITGFGNWLTLDIDQLSTYSGAVAQGTPGWTNINTPQAFIIFNPSTADAGSPVTNDVSGANGETRNFDPHSGAKYAAAWDAVPANGLTGNEDWLISPAITLGSSGNNLSFWVKSLSSSYGLEKYRVGVYVGSGSPTSTSQFVIISGNTPLQAPYGTWQQKTFALNAYNGQTVRLGIQCVSQDNYMFMVDDVVVTTTGSLGTSETETAKGLEMNTFTDGLITINSPKKIQYIKVFDTSGKLIGQELKSNTIDISTAPKGLYYVNILLADQQVVTRKVMKK